MINQMGLQMKFLFTIVSLVLIIGCTKTNEKLVNKYNLLSPDSVIVAEFVDNDIVFLGESHRRKQHAEFVNNLIPKLYKNGVKIIFTEFADYSLTNFVDSVLTALKYDENAARKIIHTSDWSWAYKEYVDLYKAVWQLNSTLKTNQKPFRIIGLQPEINYSAIKFPDDWQSVEKRKAYWNYTDSTTWVAIIEKEALEKKQKALVYCGRNHAFSKFHHPIVVDGKFIRFERRREGTQLLNSYKGKVSTVLLHSFWNDKSNKYSSAIVPFNGILDSISDLNPLKDKAYGFSTDKSSLGNLIDTTSFYSMGRDSVYLKEMCDSYIVLTPVCSLSIVSFIPDFVNELNFDYSKMQDYPNNFYTDWTIKAMNDSLRAWYQLEETYLNLMRRNCIE